jgi:hypothetical protein
MRIRHRAISIGGGRMNEQKAIVQLVSAQKGSGATPMTPDAPEYPPIAGL